MTLPDFLEEWEGGYKRAMARLLIVLLRPSLAEEIAAMGSAYAKSIRAVIGPDELARQAQERYVRGEIDAAELDRQLDRIGREFGV